MHKNGLIYICLIFYLSIKWAKYLGYHALKKKKKKIQRSEFRIISLRIHYICIFKSLIIRHEI
jgi:hypothetical protein